MNAWHRVTAIPTHQTRNPHLMQAKATRLLHDEVRQTIREVRVDR